MEKNLDYVLILEKSSSNLSAKKEGNDYFLEGVAAVFGVENSNHRIYEEQEYLPHLDYLQKKIDQNRLVGELDHPKEFDVSLKNISHVIVDLSYDKSNRNVKIKVKLLDTPAGKIAKSLIDAGIPVSISSRAAGNVKDNKKVEIKKIFTYDLVADPGFENAQLERVEESLYESLGYNSFVNDQKNSIISSLTNINESFGLRKNSNTQIYRIKDTEKISELLKENINNSKNMDNNFVTAEELNEYSLILKREMDSLKNELKSVTRVNPSSTASNNDAALEERVQRLEKYSEYLAENLENAIKYGDYLAENLEGSISYNKYLAENLDKAISYAKYLAEHVDGNISYAEYIAENLDNNIAYSKYLAENLDKNITYSEYLAENLDRGISYSEYLAEKVDQNISFSEYLAENLDRNISYSEYLAENLDRGITYSEYLAETLDKSISYSDYLGEKLNGNINYSEYIAEKVKSGIDYTEYLAESINNGNSSGRNLKTEVSKSVNEGKRTSGFSGDYSSLSSKVDQLIESVNTAKTEEIINENKFSFLKLVDNNTKKGFLSLNEAEKQKVVKALNEQNYTSGTEVVQIMGSALTEQVNSGEKFLDMIPEDLVSTWEGLNESQRASIVAQSKFYSLETPYQINHFWRTRGMVSVKPASTEFLNESQETNKPANSTVSNAYMQSIAAELDRRFRK